MKIHHRRDPDGARLLGTDLAPDPVAALMLAAIAYPPDAAAVAETRHAVARIAAGTADQGAAAWDALPAACARHRVSALAAHGIAAAGITAPPPAAAALAAAAQASTFAELRAIAESRRIEAALDAAGVAALLIKGFATALLAFGRAGLRYSRDIDVLVADADTDAACAALARLGYIRAEPPADANAGEEAAWRRAHKDMVFVDPATRVIVELHWRLFDNPHLLAQIDAQAGETRRIGNADVRTLRADLNLLYLCMHGAQHAWSRLKWLADIHAILARAPSGEADRLHAAAQDAGIGRAAAQAILLCGYLFGLDVPDAVIARLERDPRLRWLVRVALSSALGGAAVELEERPFGSTWKNLAHYWLAEGWRYRAAEFWFDLHDASAALVPVGLRWTGPAARPLAWLVRRSRGVIVPRTR